MYQQPSSATAPSFGLGIGSSLRRPQGGLNASNTLNSETNLGGGGGLGSALGLSNPTAPSNPTADGGSNNTNNIEGNANTVSNGNNANPASYPFMNQRIGVGVGATGAQQSTRLFGGGGIGLGGVGGVGIAPMGLGAAAGLSSGNDEPKNSLLFNTQIATANIGSPTAPLPPHHPFPPPTTVSSGGILLRRNLPLPSFERRMDGKNSNAAASSPLPPTGGGGGVGVGEGSSYSMLSSSDWLDGGSSNNSIRGGAEGMDFSVRLSGFGLWGQGVLKSVGLLIGGYSDDRTEAQFATRLLLDGWSAPLVNATFALYLSASLVAMHSVLMDGGDDYSASQYGGAANTTSNTTASSSPSSAPAPSSFWWLIPVIVVYDLLCGLAIYLQVRILKRVKSDYIEWITRVANESSQQNKTSSPSSPPSSSSSPPESLSYSLLLCRLPFQVKLLRRFELVTITSAVLAIAVFFIHATGLHKAAVLSSVVEPILVTYLIAPLLLIILASRLRFNRLLLIVVPATCVGLLLGGLLTNTPNVFPDIGIARITFGVNADGSGDNSTASTTSQQRLGEKYNNYFGFVIEKEHLAFSILVIVGALIVAACKEDVAREHFRRTNVVDQSLRTLQHYTRSSKRLLGDLLPLPILSRLLRGAPVHDTAKEASTVCVEFCGSIDGLIHAFGNPMLGADRLFVLITELEAEAKRFSLEVANATGDAFWCTCGLHDASLSTQHALKATRFAVAVIAWHPFRGVEMRIGLHSGPLASTVLGDTSAQTSSLDVVGAGTNISFEVAASTTPGTVLATDAFIIGLTKQVGPSVMEHLPPSRWRRIQLQSSRIPMRVVPITEEILDGESVSPLVDLHGSPAGGHVESFFDTQINPALAMGAQANYLLRLGRKRPFKLSRELGFTAGVAMLARGGGQSANNQQSSNGAVGVSRRQRGQREKEQQPVGFGMQQLFRGGGGGGGGGEGGAGGGGFVSNRSLQHSATFQQNNSSHQHPTVNSASFGGSRALTATAAVPVAADHAAAAMGGGGNSTGINGGSQVILGAAAHFGNGPSALLGVPPPTVAPSSMAASGGIPSAVVTGGGGGNGGTTDIFTFASAATAAAAAQQQQQQQFLPKDVAASKQQQQQQSFYPTATTMQHTHANSGPSTADIAFETSVLIFYSTRITRLLAATLLVAIAMITLILLLEADANQPFQGILLLCGGLFLAAMGAVATAISGSARFRAGFIVTVLFAASMICILLGVVLSNRNPTKMRGNASHLAVVFVFIWPSLSGIRLRFWSLLTTVACLILAIAILIYPFATRRTFVKTYLTNILGVDDGSGEVIIGDDESSPSLPPLDILGLSSAAAEAAFAATMGSGSHYERGGGSSTLSAHLSSLLFRAQSAESDPPSDTASQKTASESIEAYADTLSPYALLLVALCLMLPGTLAVWVDHYFTNQLLFTEGQSMLYVIRLTERSRVLLHSLLCLMVPKHLIPWALASYHLEHVSRPIITMDHRTLLISREDEAPIAAMAEADEAAQRARQAKDQRRRRRRRRALALLQGKSVSSEDEDEEDDDDDNDSESEDAGGGDADDEIASHEDFSASSDDDVGDVDAKQLRDKAGTNVGGDANDEDDDDMLIPGLSSLPMTTNNNAAVGEKKAKDEADAFKFKAAMSVEEERALQKLRRGGDAQAEDELLPSDAVMIDGVSPLSPPRAPTARLLPFASPQPTSPSFVLPQPTTIGAAATHAKPLSLGLGLGGLFLSSPTTVLKRHSSNGNGTLAKDGTLAITSINTTARTATTQEGPPLSSSRRRRTEEKEGIEFKGQRQKRQSYGIVGASTAVGMGSKVSTKNNKMNKNRKPSSSTALSPSSAASASSSSAPLRPPPFPVFQWQRMAVCTICITDLMAAHQILATDLFRQIAVLHAWISSGLASCPSLTMVRTYGDIVTIAGLGEMFAGGNAAAATLSATMRTAAAETTAEHDCHRRKGRGGRNSVGDNADATALRLVPRGQYDFQNLYMTSDHHHHDEHHNRGWLFGHDDRDSKSEDEDGSNSNSSEEGEWGGGGGKVPPDAKTRLLLRSPSPLLPPHRQQKRIGQNHKSNRSGHRVKTPPESALPSFAAAIAASGGNGDSVFLQRSTSVPKIVATRGELKRDLMEGREGKGKSGGSGVRGFVMDGLLFGNTAAEERVVDDDDIEMKPVMPPPPSSASFSSSPPSALQLSAAVGIQNSKQKRDVTSLDPMSRMGADVNDATDKALSPTSPSRMTAAGAAAENSQGGLKNNHDDAVGGIIISTKQQQESGGCLSPIVAAARRSSLLAIAAQHNPQHRRNSSSVGRGAGASLPPSTSVDGTHATPKDKSANGGGGNDANLNGKPDADDAERNGKNTTTNIKANDSGPPMKSPASSSFSPSFTFAAAAGVVNVPAIGNSNNLNGSGVGSIGNGDKITNTAGKQKESQSQTHHRNSSSNTSNKRLPLLPCPPPIEVDRYAAVWDVPTPDGALYDAIMELVFIADSRRCKGSRANQPYYQQQNQQQQLQQLQQQQQQKNAAANLVSVEGEGEGEEGASGNINSGFNGGLLLPISPTTARRGGGNFPLLQNAAAPSPPQQQQQGLSSSASSVGSSISPSQNLLLFGNAAAANQSNTNNNSHAIAAAAQNNNDVGASQQQQLLPPPPPLLGGGGGGPTPNSGGVGGGAQAMMMGVGGAVGVANHKGFSTRVGLHVGMGCGTMIGASRVTFDIFGPSMAISTRLAKAAPKDRPMASEAFVQHYEGAMARERQRRNTRLLMATSAATVANVTNTTASASNTSKGLSARGGEKKEGAGLGVAANRDDNAANTTTANNNSNAMMMASNSTFNNANNASFMSDARSDMAAMNGFHPNPNPSSLLSSHADDNREAAVKGDAMLQSRTANPFASLLLLNANTTTDDNGGGKEGNQANNPNTAATGGGNGDGGRGDGLIGGGGGGGVSTSSFAPAEEQTTLGASQYSTLIADLMAMPMTATTTTKGGTMPSADPQQQQQQQQGVPLNPPARHHSFANIENSDNQNNNSLHNIDGGGNLSRISGYTNHNNMMAGSTTTNNNTNAHYGGGGGGGAGGGMTSVVSASAVGVGVRGGGGGMLMGRSSSTVASSYAHAHPTPVVYAADVGAVGGAVGVANKTPAASTADVNPPPHASSLLPAPAPPPSNPSPAAPAAAPAVVVVVSLANPTAAHKAIAAARSQREEEKAAQQQQRRVVGGDDNDEFNSTVNSLAGTVTSVDNSFGTEHDDGSQNALLEKNPREGNASKNTNNGGGGGVDASVVSYSSLASSSPSSPSSPMLFPSYIDPNVYHPVVVEWGTPVVLQQKGPPCRWWSMPAGGGGGRERKKLAVRGQSGNQNDGDADAKDGNDGGDSSSSSCVIGASPTASPPPPLMGHELLTTIPLYVTPQTLF